MKTCLFSTNVFLTVALLLGIDVGSAGADLIGYWCFDNSTATDLSSFSNNGTVGSDVSFVSDSPFTTGLAGQTGSGGGSTRVVTIPDSTSLQTITDEFAISFWVKGTTTDNANWVRLFQKGAESSSSRSWLINRYEGTADINMRVDTINTGGQYNQNIAVGGTDVLDGEWHHMLYSVSNGRYVEYVDGEVSKSGTYLHGDGFYNTRDLYIFGRNSVGQFVGLLDDIGLWNEAIDAGYAMSAYNVNATLGLDYDLGEMLSLWSIFEKGDGGFGIVDGMPWWYTTELPGTPASEGNAYVYDDIMYVALGDGVGLMTPEPSTFVLALLALVAVSVRRRRRTM